LAGSAVAAGVAALNALSAKKSQPATVEVPAEPSALVSTWP
jgi:hypothetical protein